MTFGLRHLVSAALLHVLLFALLAGGVQCSRQPEKPPVITAVIYNPDKPPAAAQKNRKAEQERIRKELEKQKQKRDDEQKQKDLQRQKQEQEKLRLADEKKKLTEKKKLEEQKATADRKAAENEKKKKEREEQREKEEAAKRELQRQLEMEEALRREGLEREAQQEQEANAASAREAATNAWILALTEDIERNWVKPLSAPEQFKCQLRVQMLPDGSVTSARIAKSCGNAALDKSVEDAVFRASPLPKPKDPSVFQRDLIINYEP